MILLAKGYPTGCSGKRTVSSRGLPVKKVLRLMQQNQHSATLLEDPS
jgi:uncharacterized protein (DUF433 family)